MQSNIQTEYKDKIIVITGAGGVLCGGFSKTLAKCGAKVMLLDINFDSADSLAKQICLEGGIAKAYKANVLDKADLQNVKQQINADFGSVDILINGAGGNNPKATTDKEYFDMSDVNSDGVKTFFDLDSSGLQFVFDLNIMGTLLPTQVFCKDLAGKKGASVLNISSMNAFTPLTKIPAYSAAKAGVSNLTQWLAVHFSKVGIRVNAIAPGFFVTKQNEKLLFDQNGKPTARTQKILAATPMDRFGKADELDGALLFLLSEKNAAFITGVILPVDGGFSAYSGV